MTTTLAKFKNASAKYDVDCPTRGNTLFYALGLCGEAGEVAEKIMSGADRVAVGKELGDVLWYVAALQRLFECDPPRTLQTEAPWLVDKSVLEHHALVLCAEAARIGEMVKKQHRDGAPVFLVSLKKRVWNVMWQVAVIAGAHDLSVSDVAEMNVAKLESRMMRGAIRGFGDNR